MNLINTIRSNNFSLWIALVSILAQAFHSFVVFIEVGSLGYTVPGILQALIFSVTLDFFILYATLKMTKIRGWNAAKIFSVILFIINVVYYYKAQGFGFDFAVGVFIGSIIPLTMAVYAEDIRIPEDKPVVVKKKKRARKPTVESLPEPAPENAVKVLQPVRTIKPGNGK